MSETIHTLQLNLSMKLMGNLNKVDRFDSSWSSLERRAGNTLKQLKFIATVRSVGASTRIEGSRMTDEQVEVLIEKIKISKLEERDEQEVAGYYAALDTITENYLEIPVTEDSIKHLHKILMQYSDKDEWHCGDYKKHSNSVEEQRPDGAKRTIFQTTPPGFPTQDAMRALIDWYRSDHSTIPIVKIALFVYEFLSIHPFQDGNGRLSRLLVTLLLLKHGYTWIQYVSFEHEIEARKADYYKVLMDTQRQRPGENVDEWMYFFTDCLLNIQDLLNNKLTLQTSQANLSAKERAIIKFIDLQPEAKSGVIAEKLDIAQPTVKKILTGLVNKGILSKIGTGKATSYINEVPTSKISGAMFKLNAHQVSKEFILRAAVNEIELTKIILEPMFDWVSPSEWANQVIQNNLSFSINARNSKGGGFSQSFSIAGLIEPHHYQPKLILDPKVKVPFSILGEMPFQNDYPIHLEIDLIFTGNMAFDVCFVYNAIL